MQLIFGCGLYTGFYCTLILVQLNNAIPGCPWEPGIPFSPRNKGMKMLALATKLRIFFWMIKVQLMIMLHATFIHKYNDHKHVNT